VCVLLTVFLLARHYASTVFAVIACLAVHLSVRHQLVLYQNGLMWDLENNPSQ